MMRRRLSVAILVLCTLVLAAPTRASAEDALRVTVSILPQKYFVEKIGGRGVEVSVMVPPGTAAERYEPKPRQMVSLTKSAIYFAIGLPFEDVWLEKFRDANPKMLIAHTEEGIEKRSMETHSHEGDDQAAGHGGLKDPHIWLSPPLVKIQARNILDAFVKADPARRDVYEANYREFLSELTNLDATIKDIFREKEKPIEFMIFHPAWGYFADAYGLRQIPVEVEGKEPKAQELQHLVKYAREHRIKVLFVQPQFSTRTAQTVADAIGARLAPADDLAEDWAKNLVGMAREIAGK